MKVHLTAASDPHQTAHLLREADEGAVRILASVEHPANTAYLICDDERVIGAALVTWADAESELIYIGVEPAERGTGRGKAAMMLLVEEARQRGTGSLLVGTANSSLENISFYQKCGFRIDHVRRDFFDYFTEPVYDNGIEIRDMLVLRYSF